MNDSHSDNFCKAQTKAFEAVQSIGLWDPFVTMQELDDK